MQRLRTISNRKQWLAITLGMVLGMVVLSTSVYTNASSDDLTEQKNEANEETETVSELEMNAVQTATQASVERNSYLIVTLPEIAEPDTETVHEVSFLPSPSRVFKILVEHIISPNSP